MDAQRSKAAANRRPFATDELFDMVSKRVCRGGIPTPGRRQPGRWKVSAIAIDRDAADIFRFGGFRYSYSQDAVLERGRDFVLIDVLQRYAAFEAAIVPLAEP